MSRLTIEKPRFMDDIERSRFNPRVIIACLIVLAIYFAYNIVGTILGSVYVVMQAFSDTQFLTGSFSEMLDWVFGVILSEQFILIMLYSMILLIVFVLIHTKLIERRKLSTIGLVRKGAVWQYLLGAAFGALILLILLAPTIFSELGHIKYIGFSTTAILFLFAFMIQSAGEELLFRGYLLTAAARRIGVFWAVIVSSAVFAAFHLLNPEMSVLSIMTIFFLGVFFSLYIVRTNNIWGACGMHFAWNFLQGTFSEVNASGALVDYRIFEFERVSFEPSGSFWGCPEELIGIAVLLVVISIILFAGKKRLLVKRPVAETGE